MPRIRLVEEHDAQGRTREIYKYIKETLRIPFVNSFFKMLAYYPGVLDDYWIKVKPNISTQFFVNAARHIRAVSDGMVGNLFEYIDDYAWLEGHGFSREDMREIRYAVEMFHYILPKICLLSTHLRLALAGEELSPREKRESSLQEPDFSVALGLVRPQSAPREVEYVYLDVLDTTKLPILNTIYQVFGRWPEYLKHIWHDEIKPVVFTNDYQREAQRLKEVVDELARQLPYPYEPASDLGAETREQVLKVAGYFDKATPGQMIVASGVRSMLIEGERRARARAERLERNV